MLMSARLDMTVEVGGRQMPVKKCTGIISNSAMLTGTLANLNCRGLHTHAQLFGGKASECQVCPDKFCRVVCDIAMKGKLMIDTQDNALSRLAKTWVKQS